MPKWACRGIIEEEMEMNCLICHKDIARIGYYFLDRDQEERFLKSINGQLTHDSSHGLVPALRSDSVLRRLPH